MRIPSVNRLGARPRGVVLLVVLTLLSLFVVIGTTFLLVASHYMRAAQSQARVGMYGDPPQKLLDAAVYQVVRGTRDPNSNVGTNDLLADLYGLDGFIAYAAVANVAGNTLTLHVPVPEVNWSLGYPYGAPPSMSVGDFVFWRSIRDRQTAYFPQSSPPSSAANQAPWMFGYYTGQQLTFINVLPNPAMPAVIPPNGLRNNTVPITSYARRISASPPAAPFPFSDLPLDSNGQYEYAEIQVTWPNNAYQAPSLNAIAGNAVNAVVTILVNGRPHNGMSNNVAYPDEPYDAVDNANLYLADPVDLDMPSFRGIGPVVVNPGPSSVDTDGDGTRDARWIDIGLPLQTGRNGRQVRPLVAIRCVDLDGRINLNFHGSNAHLTTPATWTILDSTGTPRYRPSRGNASTDPLYSNMFSIPSRGQGSGTGPADVTLFDVLAQAAHDAMPTLANNVKEGAAAAWYAQLLAMRYGMSSAPGIVGDDATTVGSPAELKFRNYLASSSFIDFHSALRYGMDPRGMPALEPPYHAGPLIDSPYELRVDALRGYAPNASDALFGLAELERLLRASDWDANAIPSRLLNPVLYDVDGNGTPDPLMLGAMPNFRNSVTTESWDLGLLKLQQLVNKGGPSPEPINAFVELVEPRLPNNLTADQMRALMERLVTERTLPPEVVYGMPLDLNRPLTQLNLANPNAYADRQLLARQLYVLMLVVGNVTNPTDYARIAQWAINVVDFRDQDSVMTPFEYDTNPFNGWDVDSDLTTTNETAERAVVWGCERPELLITEAMAWHDVRVNRSGMTYQQPYRPRGAAFVELYNPWATSSYGSDLNRWGVNFNNGVPITQTAPGGAPVWRLEFRRVADNETRYAYFTTPVGSNAPMPPERTYFSNTTSNPLFIMPGQYGVVGSVGWPIDPNSVGFNSDIDNDGQNDFVNPLGLPVGAVVPPEPDYLTSRRIQMSFGPNGQTYLTHVDGTSSFPMPVVACVLNQFLDNSGSNNWRSFNLSEPLVGYGSDAWNTPAAFPLSNDMEQKYITPVGTPFDENFHIQAGSVLNAEPQYAAVRLQRLANPYIAYHNTVNPYHTVDEFTGMGLTRLNGISSDPSSPDPINAWERGSRLWNSLNPQVSATTTPRIGGSHYFNENVHTTLGFLNRTCGVPELTPMTPATTPAGLPPNYFVGCPTTGPFPWLTWLNRAYQSQYELNDVPATSSEELLRQFTEPLTYTGAATHLLPILDYRSSGGQNTGNLAYQILHFTRARSPFLSAETIVDLDGDGTADVLPRREPGKVNVNTVPNETVWISLWNGVDWNGTDAPQAGDTIASSWMPMLGSTIRPLRQTSPFQTPLMSAPADQDNWNWLFADGTAGRWPRMTNGIVQMNGDLHTAYRFHGLNRLANSVTTSSNVFAVWITVGYFEMTPTGMLSGMEYNAETGEQKRHRAFYIIDRSIPVGYEPGESHNVDRLILLRRIIE